MEKKLDRNRIVRNFTERANEGSGLGPVLEMGQEHANLYRNYVTNRLVHKYLKLDRNDAVLDFGCGVGRTSRFMATRCKTIEAIDATPALIDYAQTNFKNPGNIQYHVSEDETLKYADATFDKILAFWVFQHMGDAEVNQALKEFKRVIRPGGRIAVFEQTIPHPIVYEDWSIQRSPEEYAKMGTDAGLKLITNEPALRNPSRGMYEWMRLKRDVNWLLPFLYAVDRMTLKRKPQFVEYYTTALVFEG